MSISESMPDVARQTSKLTESYSLERVGMSGIEFPIILKASNGNLVTYPAFVDAFVNLCSAEHRGIHMSRLYLEAEKVLTSGPLDFDQMQRALLAFISSHSGLSDRAEIHLKFNALLKRKALESSHFGWRSYPIKMSAAQIKNQAAKVYVELQIMYSSTCPASAALARQLIKEEFSKQKSEVQEISVREVVQWLGTEEGVVATPHAQRSIARVRIELNGALVPSPMALVEQLVDAIEAVLKTPVQAAVKREDEKKFALLNGQNLMFCEDAARRVYQALSNLSVVKNFIVEARHFESLHPHDAVSLVKTTADIDFYD